MFDMTFSIQPFLTTAAFLLAVASGEHPSVAPEALTEGDRPLLPDVAPLRAAASFPL